MLGLWGDMVDLAMKPENFGSIITAMAIIFSAGVAIVIGVYNSSWSTRAGRTKATFDVLNQRQWDKDYIKARKLFIKARNQSANGVLEAAKADTSRSPGEGGDGEITVGQAIRLVMNDYELLFIAIEENVLDDKILEKLQKSTIVNDYERTKSYVEWVRSAVGNQDLYKVFQRNAKKWANGDDL